MSEIEGLRELSADLGRIAASALPEVDAITKKGADNVKKQMIEDVKASPHFSSKRGRGLQGSISYDRAYSAGEVGYEIGPDKARGGGIGNIAYFGGANGGGGTLDIDGPLKAEEPRLMKALDDFLGGL